MFKNHFPETSTTLLLQRPRIDDDRIQARRSFAELLHIDVTLVVLVLLVMTYGLVVLYSASNASQILLFKQIAHFVIGLLFMFAIAQIDLARIWRFIPLVYFLGVTALILTEFVGVANNGSQRWLGVRGVITFQPSELMKLILPVMIAWYVTRDPLPVSFRTMCLCVGIIALPSLFVLRQPDLGTAIILIFCGLSVLFLAGLSWRIIVTTIVAIVLLAPLMWEYVLHDYHRGRIYSFLSPSSDPLGTGWNAIQSMIAIGSGGVSGKGWTMGSQATLGFLPESHTDFIFSVLSEEFGFMGVMVLLCLYGALIWRGLAIASKAQQTATRLIAAALIMIILIYTFVNIAMVSALLPVVGVPLPFVSYGGTSAVSILIALGFIMSIATHKRQINR